MKNKEELNAIKEEIKTVKEKLQELTSEELNEVTGGKTDFNTPFDFNIPENNKEYEIHVYGGKETENFIEK